jgi:Aldehyde dehydrogenase family
MQAQFIYPVRPDAWPSLEALTGGCIAMEMLIGGSWRPAASGRAEEVTSPFDGAVIGTVPVGDAGDVRAALDRAEAGADIWRRTPAHERMRILMRAAELADERAEQTAKVISAEAGKVITEARGEASRSGDLIRLAAFEGTQLNGDALPLDANRGTGLDKLGFTLHQPVGVVVAITPFNYPALLVMHKRAAHHADRRDQEAVAGAGLLLPGRHPAGRGHRTCGHRRRRGRVRQRGPGLHLGAAGHHPPGHRRGLPRRVGA